MAQVFFECVLIVVYFFYDELFLYWLSQLVCENFDAWTFIIP